ncbi:MAG: hypothetical protein Q4E65_02890 [Clostridia bacterium]|nr:hypothetical protein [Clostridia bacterium]
MRRIFSLCLAVVLVLGVAVSASAAGTLVLHELWPLGGDTHPANGQASRLPVASFSNGYGAALRVLPHFTIDSSGATPVSSGGFLDSAGQGWPMPDYDPSTTAARVRPTAITSSNENVVHVDWIGFEYPHVVLIAMGAGTANVTITDQMGKQAVIPVTIQNRRGNAVNYDGDPVTIGNREWPFSIMMPQYVKPAFDLMQRYASAGNEYYAIFTSVPGKLGHKMIYEAANYGGGNVLTVPAGARLIIPDRMIWSLGNTTLRIEGTLVITRGGYLNLFASPGKSAALEIGPNGAIHNEGLIVATEQSMLTDELVGHIDGDGAVGLISYSDLTWDAGGNHDPNGDAVADADKVTIVKRPLLNAADGAELERAAAAAGYSAFGEKFELQAWSGARSDANDPARGIIYTLPKAETVKIPYAVVSGAVYKAAHKLQNGSIVYEDMRVAADGTGLEMTITACSPFMIVQRGGSGGGSGTSRAINSGFTDFDLAAWREREAEAKRLKEEKLGKTPVAGVPSTGGAACGMVLLVLAGAIPVLKRRKDR